MVPGNSSCPVNQKHMQEMISISTKCLLSDPDTFVCICYIPVLFEFNKILFTPKAYTNLYYLEIQYCIPEPSQPKVEIQSNK